MNERARMHYLDAMGIDMFVPRKRLPAAKPSLQLVQANPAPVAVPAPAASTAPEAAGLRSAQAVIEHTLAKWLPEVAPASTPPTPVAATPLAKPVRFALQVWQSGPWMLLDTHQPHLALPTEAIAQNLLAALTGQFQPLTPHLVHWPLVENPNTPSGWQAPREMLTAFLAPRLQQQPAQLLLMGAASYLACTLEDSRFSQALWQRLTLPHLNTQAWVVPSLSDLLRHPETKAQLWQCLQPFAQPYGQP